MKRVGEKLRVAREFLNLTQEQVAQSLDLTRDVVLRIEGGKRNIRPEELLKFSKLYGISMEEIVSDEKSVDLSLPMFARNFDKLSEKDKKEIISLIKFKESYKD